MSKLQTATYKVAAFLLVVPERFERPTLRFVVCPDDIGPFWFFGGPFYVNPSTCAVSSPAIVCQTLGRFGPNRADFGPRMW